MVPASVNYFIIDLELHVTASQSSCYRNMSLTHWVTHICVSKLAIIGSDNGLLPDRRQAIIWTNAGLLLIGPLGTNFSKILIEILIFSFKKMRLKMSSAKRRPFCPGFNVLIGIHKLTFHIAFLHHPVYPILHWTRSPEILWCVRCMPRNIHTPLCFFCQLLVILFDGRLQLVRSITPSN